MKRTFDSIIPKISLSFSSHQVLEGRIGNRMEKNSVKVFLHVSVFEATPFIGKSSQARFSWASYWYDCTATGSGRHKQYYCL